MIVEVTNELAVNTDHVMSVEVESRHYMNGSDSQLVIRMMDGHVHRLRSSYYGPSVWEMQRKLVAQIEE